MVNGFTDGSGKFHPTDNEKKSLSVEQTDSQESKPEINHADVDALKEAKEHQD